MSTIEDDAICRSSIAYNLMQKDIESKNEEIVPAKKEATYMDELKSITEEIPDSDGVLSDEEEIEEVSEEITSSLEYHKIAFTTGNISFSFSPKDIIDNKDQLVIVFSEKEKNFIIHNGSDLYAFVKNEDKVVKYFVHFSGVFFEYKEYTFMVFHKKQT